MNYFVAKDLVNGVEDLFYTNRPIVKGDYVVIPNYNDEPITAMVTNIVSRFKALKMNIEPPNNNNRFNTQGYVFVAFLILIILIKLMKMPT